MATDCGRSWYLVTAIDRWIHYDRRLVAYGYVLLPAIWEAIRVLSGVMLLWGTYEVVWRELEDKYTKKEQGYMWRAAQVSLFLVGLVSIFYVVLNLAVPIVWMQWLSLNTIADIASKRTAFELAMATFFFVFGFLTVCVATVTFFYQARKIVGQRSEVSGLIYGLSLLF
jgi:hypothetical protein